MNIQLTVVPSDDVFIVFVVLCKDARNAWIKLLCSCCQSKDKDLKTTEIPMKSRKQATSPVTSYANEDISHVNDSVEMSRYVSNYFNMGHEDIVEVSFGAMTTDGDQCYDDVRDVAMYVPDCSPHFSQEEAPANCIENVYVDVLDEPNAVEEDEEEQEVEVIECSIRTCVQRHSTRRHTCCGSKLTLLLVY